MLLKEVTDHVWATLLRSYPRELKLWFSFWWAYSVLQKSFGNGHWLLCYQIIVTKSTLGWIFVKFSCVLKCPNMVIYRVHAKICFSFPWLSLIFLPWLYPVFQVVSLNYTPFSMTNLTDFSIPQRSRTRVLNITEKNLTHIFCGTPQPSIGAWQGLENPPLEVATPHPKHLDQGGGHAVGTRHDEDKLLKDEVCDIPQRYMHLVPKVLSDCRPK